MDWNRTLILNSPSYQAIFSCRDDKKKLTMNSRVPWKLVCPWKLISNMSKNKYPCLCFIRISEATWDSPYTCSSSHCPAVCNPQSCEQWNSREPRIQWFPISYFPCSYFKEILIHMLAEIQDTGTRKLHFSLLRIFLNFIIKYLI